MKKKTIIIILITAIILIIFYISPLFKYMITEIRYGNDYCEYNGKTHAGNINATVITNWRCEACFKSGTHSNSGTPKLCDNCSSITQRCKWCGKRLHNA